MKRYFAKADKGRKKGGRIGLKSGKSPKHGRSPKWPKQPLPPKWRDIDKWRDWGKGRKIPEGIFGLGEKGKPHSTKEGKEATMKRARERLRSKKGVGGIAKILGKKAVDWIKKNRKTIRKEVYSPEGKKKTKDMLDKLKKKYPDSQMFGPGKAKGGRIGYQGGGRTRLLEELGRVEAEPSNRNRRAEVSRVHRELNKGYKDGGSTMQQHYLQHGYGPTKAKLRAGKPKIAKKGWS